jgi:hypothetical protein
MHAPQHPCMPLDDVMLEHTCNEIPALVRHHHPDAQECELFLPESIGQIIVDFSAATSCFSCCTRLQDHRSAPLSDFVIPLLH